MVGSRVYVGGLPYGVRERDLEKFFKGYGRTRDILIKNGYGFVEFEDYRDADDAVYELNGKELLGERVVVEPARGTARGGQRDRYDDRYNNRGRGRYHNDKSSRYGPPVRTEYRLIVENLSSRVSWQDLKDYMRQAGEVTYADAHKQRRNEGVVEFASLADMKTAIEKLDDTELNGRRVHLIEDHRGGRSGGDRRSRSSSSRSRSRSRRGTRSRSSSSTKSRSVTKSKSRSKSKSKEKYDSRTGSHSPHYAAKDNTRSRSNSKRESRSKSDLHMSRDDSLSDNRSRSGSPRKSRSSRSLSPKSDHLSENK